LTSSDIPLREGPDDIVCLHKIAPGHAGKSYGLHVARLAGVPWEVLQRAEQVLGELESRPLDGNSPPRAA
jgi:DNA mismatch repair protein MutS